MRHVPRAGLKAGSADGTAVSIVVLYWAQVVSMVIRSAFYAQIFLRRSLGVLWLCSPVSHRHVLGYRSAHILVIVSLGVCSEPQQNPHFRPSERLQVTDQNFKTFGVHIGTGTPKT